MGYTRFEEARLLGARALQLAMGAPAQVKPKGTESVLELANEEFKTGKIPITIINK